MKVIFENDIGKVLFGDNEKFKITAISGLYLPTKTYGSINYAGYDGQYTYQSVSNARIITMNVDIVSKNIRAYLEGAIKVFNKEGKLILDYGDKVRRIMCNQVNFSLLERSFSHAVFTLQLVCDDPYFTDVSSHKLGIHGSVANISNPITFPCVLSTSDTKRKITNPGDVKVYPIITVSVRQKGEQSDISVSGYKFKNNTTGKMIYLQYISSLNETIVIDVAKRSVTSSINGSIVEYLHADTNLEDFYLAPGINSIEAIDLGDGDFSRMELEFETKYVEAVY